MERMRHPPLIVEPERPSCLGSSKTGVRVHIHGRHPQLKFDFVPTLQTVRENITVTYHDVVRCGMLQGVTNLENSRAGRRLPRLKDICQLFSSN